MVISYSDLSLYYSYFNNYYYTYFLLLLLVSSSYGLFRGQAPNNPLFHFFLQLAIFPIFWIPTNNYSPLLGKLFLCYLISYLNLNQFYGSSRFLRRLTSNPFLSFFHSYWGCQLIKTTPIEQQCILALHPHGLLPYCTLINVVTESNHFSTLFPVLANRLLVVASALFYFPFLRDILLSYGLIDASRFNFEHWLMKGHSICVYVGGAHEALYANPDNDVLDLRRKTGFMKLAMKHQIPIVPCYTFNEINHHAQVNYTTTLKFPFLLFIRQFVHSSTGLCLPLITSWIPSSQQHVVTVVGRPSLYSNKRSLQKNMEIYMKELKELYEKYSPKYNTQKRKLQIYS